MSSKLLKAARTYAKRGWRVLPVHAPVGENGCTCGRANCACPGKHPKVKGWVDDATTNLAEIQTWWETWPSANVGVAFGRETGLIDIEVDPRSGGDKRLKELEGILGELPQTMYFRSGGGGIHRLFRYPRKKVIRKQTHFGRGLLNTRKTGVDVLSDGAQAVMPPSHHASGNVYEWDDWNLPIANLPKTWVKALATRNLTVSPEGSTEESLLERLDDILPDVNLVEAQRIISFLSADCDRDTWIMVGQAMKTQFPDNEDAAFDVWDRWSATADDDGKYPGGVETRYQWDSFRKSGVTMRSVIKLAQSHGYKPIDRTDAKQSLSFSERETLRLADEEYTARMKKRLWECQTDDEMLSIAEDIRSTEMFAISREDLTEEYRDTYDRIHPGKKKMTKQLASKILSDDVHREKMARGMAKRDGWYKPYVYVASSRMGAFYNCESGVELSVSSFNDMYSSKLVTPVRKAQGNISPIYPPADLVLNCDMVKKVNGVMYMPGKPLIFSRNGKRYVNTYRSPDIDSTDPMYQDKDETEAVKRIRKHLEWLVGEDRAKILIQFLAYIVQNPSKRVRWCYLIIGPKGIGKSFTGELARAVLGDENVKDVGQGTLQHTTFNAWAAGSQLSVIEEIRVDGVKKWEIMNSLKAIVTNNTIDLHAKGKDPQQVVNTTSLLAFTNFENALALEQGERRYFIAHTLFWNRSDFIFDLGGPGQARQYFNRLFGALRYASAIRGWLETIDLSDFDPTQAIETDTQQELVDLSMSDLELAVRQVIADFNVREVSNHVINVGTLRDVMSMEPDIRLPSYQQLARQLRDMGYVKVPGAVRVEGKQGSWYVRPQYLRHKVARKIVKTALAASEKF